MEDDFFVVSLFDVISVKDGAILGNETRRVPTVTLIAGVGATPRR
jgi:hypothetical protein